MLKKLAHLPLSYVYLRLVPHHDCEIIRLGQSGQSPTMLPKLHLKKIPDQLGRFLQAVRTGTSFGAVVDQTHAVYNTGPEESEQSPSPTLTGETAGHRKLNWASVVIKPYKNGPFWAPLILGETRHRQRTLTRQGNQLSDELRPNCVN